MKKILKEITTHPQFSHELATELCCTQTPAMGDSSLSMPCLMPMWPSVM